MVKDGQNKKSSFSRSPCWHSPMFSKESLVFFVVFERKHKKSEKKRNKKSYEKREEMKKKRRSKRTKHKRF